MCRFRSKGLLHTYFVAAHHGPTKHFGAYAMNVNDFIGLTETAGVFKIR